MSTTLVLQYVASVEVKLPHDIADKMRSGELEWDHNWGKITAGEFTAEGGEPEVDYKRLIGYEFQSDAEERRLAWWKEHLATRAERLKIVGKSTATLDYDALQNSEKSENGSILSGECGDKEEVFEKYD